jgi:hypothetical protein
MYPRQVTDENSGCLGLSTLGFQERFLEEVTSKQPQRIKQLLTKQRDRVRVRVGLRLGLGWVRVELGLGLGLGLVLG